MKIKYILVFLLLLPISYADLELTDIRGYVDNERIPDIDEDGGDFEVMPEDIIDLVVRLDNVGNETIQARLETIIENIDDGDDIVKEQDWYDIEKDDDRSKTLSFSIPSDTRNDNYDMELEIFFKFGNGTEGTVDNVDFEVIVEKEVDEEDEVTISDLLGNLTSSCGAIVETTNTCFGYIEKSETCNNDLSTIAEERGTYKQKSEDCGGTLEGVKSEKAELEREKTALNSQINSMISRTDCNNQTATAVRSERNESDSKFNQTIGVGAVAALGYWYWQKRKKEKATVETSYQADYFKK